MYPEVLELHGCTILPYIQLYVDLDHPDNKSGELLVRLTDNQSPFDLISQLNVDEHLKLVAWQVQVAQDLATNHKIKSSINVDNKVIVDKDTRDRLLALVGQAPAGTTFEFTETHVMPSPAEANRMFWAIREAKCSTALDDFGTGLNGMTLLTDYDFDIVKIDQSLIRDIGRRPEKLRIVSLLLEMLSALNKTHVVEGVESQEDFELLSNAKFRTFQGFLFHKPIPVAELKSGLSTDDSVKEAK